MGGGMKGEGEGSTMECVRDNKIEKEISEDCYWND